MKTTQEILQEVNELPARERAAAIAHYIYMKATQLTQWNKRVPTAWKQLTSDARDFNLASIDVWANEPDLYDAWHGAIQQLREKEK